jgi:O-acetyl-ADP-ribose deacetylase (regulator of RNase III)
MYPDSSKPLSKDSIVIARHVWEYMQKCNRQELRDIQAHCKLDVHFKSEEEFTVNAKASHHDLDIWFEKGFIPFYQGISNRLTLAHYDPDERDSEYCANKLEKDYDCVALPLRDGRLRVTCQSVDKERIDRFMKQYDKTPVHKSMTVSPQLEPVGYLVAGCIQVFLHMCDITSMSVDAIINPANTELRAYGGLSKIIAKAAGSQMRDECKQLLRGKGGVLHVGQVVHTSGGRLLAKNILHVAGPIWPKINDVSTQKQCLSKLTETFQNVVRYAEKRKLESVAIPPISSGNLLLSWS